MEPKKVPTQVGESLPPLQDDATIRRFLVLNRYLPPREISQEVQTWRMRWCFFFLLALWILAAIATTIVVFCLTHSPLSFSLFSTLAPPIYLSYRFAKYLLPLPMSQEEFTLKALKIHQQAEHYPPVRTSSRRPTGKRRGRGQYHEHTKTSGPTALKAKQSSKKQVH